MSTTPRPSPTPAAGGDADLDRLIESAMAASTSKVITALEELLADLKAGVASRRELAKRPGAEVLDGLRNASATRKPANAAADDERGAR